MAPNELSYSRDAILAPAAPEIGFPNYHALVTSVDIIGTKKQLISVASSGKSGTKTDLVATSSQKTGNKTEMEAISME
jgi:hypothetical protein